MIHFVWTPSLFSFVRNWTVIQVVNKQSFMMGKYVFTTNYELTKGNQVAQVDNSFVLEEISKDQGKKLWKTCLKSDGWITE